MAGTLTLVAMQLVILSVVGLATLAPVPTEVREKLLPAAPVFGATLIAAVSNWTSRWLSIKVSLPIMAVVAIALFCYGLKAGHRPWVVPKRTLATLGVCLAACCGGFAVAAVPVAVAGDTNAVAPSFSVDEFYFSGVSTYLVDHPVLPGPTMENSWIGNDPPASAPAADTVAHRFRFGQSAVAATLSVLVFHSPYTTVTAISLVWLLALGVSAYVLCQLMGLSQRWSLLAPPLVSSSFYVVAQPLEGKNDGLLGASFFLIAIAVSIGLLKDSRHTWALVIVGAGLAASYSEYFLLLVPVIVLLALVGPTADLLHRLNMLAGRWAAAAIAVPWAWVWLGQSFKTSTRFTNGPTPFAERSGWALLRAYVGVPTVNAGWLNVLLTLAAVVVLLGMGAGWAATLRWHPARGAVMGLLGVFLVLEARAASTQSGNLQYRTMQLSVPALVCMAVVGWSLILARRSATRGQHATPPRRAMRVANLAAGTTGVLLVATNLTTAAATTSHQRAENQHVPQAFTAKVAALVKKVGGQNVSVVTPNLTDTAALSMVLAQHDGVSYPVPVSSSYVGNFPQWDRQPDLYYVVGPGTTVAGDVTVIDQDNDYRVVRLGPTGMIFAPFEPHTWLRLSWMRGFPCATSGVKLLVIRGAASSERFWMSSEAPGGSSEPLALNAEDGTPLKPLRRHTVTGDWRTQGFRTPAAWNSILTLTVSPDLGAAGRRSIPLVFDGDQQPSSTSLTAVDPHLARTCLAGIDDGSDGYDREITFMKLP